MKKVKIDFYGSVRANFSKLSKHINNPQFDMFVQQAVSLNAKNTSNFHNKDLAMQQLLDLAHNYTKDIEVI